MLSNLNKVKSMKHTRFENINSKAMHYINIKYFTVNLLNMHY